MRQLRHWQRVLGLQAWEIGLAYKKFERTDFVQSGDFEANSDAKKATIILADEQTGRDSSVILHELIHVLLWKHDSFSESKIGAESRDEYLELLENVVDQLTKTILQLHAERNS